MVAPRARNKASRPMATGKLRVISGIRLPRMGLLAWPAPSPFLANSLPHTRQRVASSLRRVPQVGQSLVEVGFSVVIRLIRVCSRFELWLFAWRTSPGIGVQGQRLGRLQIQRRLYQPFSRLANRPVSLILLLILIRSNTEMQCRSTEIYGVDTEVYCVFDLRFYLFSCHDCYPSMPSRADLNGTQWHEESLYSSCLSPNRRDSSLRNEK